MSLNLLPVSGEPAGGAERRNRHFNALAEAIAEILFITTADGRAVEMPAWQELTGQTADEIVAFGWLAALHPDDVAETQRPGHARPVRSVPGTVAPSPRASRRRWTAATSSAPGRWGTAGR